ncbi:MAG: CoA transferase [Chloroflexi bacterium]|nr:CoA transferase [Chloroflexota bacterium]
MSNAQNIEKQRLPLAPYRVLDLTDESGVFCTKILAALGADVIKIEPPGGDPTRRIGPFYHDDPDPGKSLHWFTYNLNKKSITLNLERASGRELFQRLARTAHFIVECFRPGHLDALGLGYPEVNAINPGIVFTSITPWGSTGPHSKSKGSNLVVSAASGFLHLCGDEDGPPVQIATPMAYVQTGLEAAAATMVAHTCRQRTGRGQHVDVSAQESLMGQIVPPILWRRSLHLVPYRTRMGALARGRPVLMDLFPTRDGWVVCHTTYDRGRKPLREWLAGEGMAGDLFDKKWDAIFLEAAVVSREEKEHIDDLFRAFAARHTKDELMWGAQERGIQIAKVNGVEDVMNDAHLRERDYFVSVEHPELGGSILYAGAPFKSDGMAWRYSRRAPFVGEHNAEIYGKELGLSTEDMVALKEGGVI